MPSSKAQHRYTHREDVTVHSKRTTAAVLTSPLQLELPASAGVCRLPEAGWKPANTTRLRGQAAADAPAPCQVRYRRKDSVSRPKVSLRLKLQQAHTWTCTWLQTQARTHTHNRTHTHTHTSSHTHTHTQSSNPHSLPPNSGSQSDLRLCQMTVSE